MAKQQIEVREARVNVAKRRADERERSAAEDRAEAQARAAELKEARVALEARRRVALAAATAAADSADAGGGAALQAVAAAERARADAEAFLAEREAADKRAAQRQVERDAAAREAGQRLMAQREAARALALEALAERAAKLEAVEAARRAALAAGRRGIVGEGGGGGLRAQSADRRQSGGAVHESARRAAAEAHLDAVIDARADARAIALAQAEEATDARAAARERAAARTRAAAADLGAYANGGADDEEGVVRMPATLAEQRARARESAAALAATVASARDRQRADAARLVARAAEREGEKRDREEARKAELAAAAALAAGPLVLPPSVQAIADDIGDDDETPPPPPDDYPRSQQSQQPVTAAAVAAAAVSGAERPTSAARPRAYVPEPARRSGGAVQLQQSIPSAVSTSARRTSPELSAILDSHAPLAELYNVGTRVLGKGSYGEVRLATHRLSGVSVAVKTIDKAKLNDPKLRTRAREEVRLHARLAHTHVVKLLEVVDEPQRLHLVLEYAAGGSLRDALDTQRRFAEEAALLILKQLMGALHYVHESESVVHRDIKLDNVLLDAGGAVKLADFGFAVLTPRDKKLKLLCGSPHYSAPEIFAQQEYFGRAADVWSLGVLIYTMLMGAFPFDAPDMTGLRRKVIAGRWDRPLSASKEANDVVRKMLVVDPMRRCSLEEVMRSPWLRRVSPSFENFPTAPTPPTEPDADVLAWLAQRGCPAERVDGLARQLREKEKDHFTAAYELLALQKARGTAQGGGEAAARASAAR